MKSTLLLKNIGDATTEITLQVSYHVNFNETTKIKVQEFSISIKTNQESEKTIEFDDLADRDLDVLILVQKPKGNIIAQKSFILNEIIGKKQIIEFAAKDEIELSDSDAIRNPPFVYGRLLDKKGEKNFEDVQIIIYVKKEGEKDFSPLTSVKTEVQGYFAFEYPADIFTEAVASIGLELSKNPMPIKLESRTIKVKNERGVEEEKSVSVFPRRVILVVDINENLAEKIEPIDCGCHASEFSEKKVLEEFSFFSLIRTSQPEIMGYVIKDEDEITLWEILNNLPSSVFDILEPIKAIPFISRVSPIKSNTIKSVSKTGTTKAVSAKVTADENEINESLRAVKINKNVLTNFIRDEKAITKDNISKLFALNDIHRLQNALISKPTSTKPLGRVELGSTNSVDWDDEPTIYQAVSIAHGHLLQFKSEWLADGYSLGDLLYSLPLAPGQKKQIVVFDWERRESAANEQSIDYEESLNNSLTRDRDISEIAAGVLQENIKGGSTSKVRSISGGISVPVGSALIGVSGGGSNASTNAWQNNLRQTSSSDQQKLRERIIQSANAVRNMRSTVIQTVSQGERFEISSESVANYNHCHAMTIQYYEVLRHFKIRQRFAEAKEVLFVPLLMTQFTKEKLLRWRESLSEVLIDRRLLKGFDAADRVEHQWKDSGFPSGTYASQNIVTASGTLKIQFVIQRPRDKSDENGKSVLDTGAWSFFNSIFGVNFVENFYKDYLENQERKDEIFHKELGEKIARGFINKLSFQILDETQKSLGEVPIDASLTSRYYKDGVLNVKLNWNTDLRQRDKIYYLKINMRRNLFDIANPQPLLPEGSFITVVSGVMNYRTAFSNGTLFKFQNIGDDLSSYDGVTIYTGPSMEELKDPRKEDVNIVNKLIAHLNDNLEYYHRAIWLDMSPERRFMLLDGIVLNGKGEGRSVASLVENELLTVVGNSLVFPVASGLNLNPDFGQKESLTEYYMTAAAEPISISVPTKGVFAEAVMGKCNSCEKIDESRFWRWEESPIPDSPTAINPINTDSRRADPGNLQPQQMPNPIVNIQNAPNAPDPTGLAGTLGLLGQSNLFKDITGIEGTQRNAIQGMQSTLDTAKVFAQESAKLETQKMMERRLDKAMNAIDADESISPEKKAELKEKALNAYMGAGATKTEVVTDPKSEQFKQRVKNIDDMIKDKTITPEDGIKMKEKEMENFVSTVESKPVASLEGIEKASDTAAKNNTSIEVEPNGGIKITPINTTVAGSASRTKLPSPIIQQRNLSRKAISTGHGGVLQNEDIYEGAILLYDFDVNDSQLKTEHIPVLNDLASKMQSDERILIALEGHASQTGNEANNLLISENRVQAVYDYLVHNQGVRQTQIIGFYGLGSADPIINNKKVEENLNRSVYIRYSLPVTIIKPVPTISGNGTNKWQIKMDSQIGLGIYVGAAMLGGTIRSADPLYVAQKNGLLIAGITGFDLSGASASIDSDWINFETDAIYNINDFDGTFCIFSTFELTLLLFGYQKARLSFPNMGANRINVGGWQIGTPGASAAGMYGVWTIQ